jgi:pimeloyl-ACP methyl ester carboxylesterase
VLDALKKEVAQHPVELVVFVHGWNNDGQWDKGNLKSFREALAAMDRVSAKGNRRIFGVYMSWRGKTRDFPTFVDYYNREATAVKIGRVEATAALQALCTTAKRNPDSRVLAVGHSFGGLILLRAVAQPLAAQIAMSSMSGKRADKEIRPMADTVVVVNPADNSLLARQLVSAMTQFNVKYQKGGMDVPLIVSITAKEDYLTRSAYTAASAIARYPLGSFMTSSAGKSSSWSQEGAAVTSIGFHQRIHSHTLDREEDAAPSSPDHADKTDGMNVDRLIRSNVTPRAGKDPKLIVWLDPKGDGNGDLYPYHLHPIAPKEGEAPLNTTPYWIMQVDKFICKGHTDIWNANFAGLVTALHQASVFETPARKKGVLPKGKETAAPPKVISAPPGILKASEPR